MEGWPATHIAPGQAPQHTMSPCHTLMNDTNFLVNILDMESGGKRLPCHTFHGVSVNGMLAVCSVSKTYSCKALVGVLSICVLTQCLKRAQNATGDQIKADGISIANMCE